MVEIPDIKASKEYEDADKAISDLAEELLFKNRKKDTGIVELQKNLDVQDLTHDELQKLRDSIELKFGEQLKLIAMNDLKDAGMEVDDFQTDKEAAMCRGRLVSHDIVLIYNSLYQIQSLRLDGVLIQMKEGAGHRLDLQTFIQIEHSLELVNKQADSIESVSYNGLYLEAEVVVKGITLPVMSNGFQLYKITCPSNERSMERWREIKTQIFHLHKEANSASDKLDIAELEKQAGILEKEASTVLLETIPPENEQVTLRHQLSLMGRLTNPKWEYATKNGTVLRTIEGVDGQIVSFFENGKLSRINKYNWKGEIQEVDFPVEKYVDIYESNEPVIRIENSAAESNPIILLSNNRRMGTYKEEKVKNTSLTTEMYLNDLKAVISNPERIQMFFEHFGAYIVDSERNQYIQTASETLERGMKGDCDDYAEFACSQLRANGYNAYSIRVIVPTSSGDQSHATCIYWKRAKNGQWEVGKIGTLGLRSTVASSLEEGVKTVLEKAFFKHEILQGGKVYIYFPSRDRRRDCDVYLSTIEKYPNFPMEYATAMNGSDYKSQFEPLEKLHEKYPDDVQVATSLAYASYGIKSENTNKYIRELFELGANPYESFNEVFLEYFIKTSELDEDGQKKFFQKIAPAVLKRNIQLLQQYPEMSALKRENAIEGVTSLLRHADYSDEEIKKDFLGKLVSPNYESK